MSFRGGKYFLNRKFVGVAASVALSIRMLADAKLPYARRKYVALAEEGAAAAESKESPTKQSEPQANADSSDTEPMLILPKDHVSIAGNLVAQRVGKNKISVSFIEGATELDAAWVESKKNCSFCEHFLQSPCGIQFAKWSACVDHAKLIDENFAASCVEYTDDLIQCTKAHPEYFAAQQTDEDEGAEGENGDAHNKEEGNQKLTSNSERTSATQAVPRTYSKHERSRENTAPFENRAVPTEEDDAGDADCDSER